jgi:glycosyltransferase involved in cell wall biosynthesis
MREGDADGLTWLRGVWPGALEIDLEAATADSARPPGNAARVDFTGRLDHRFAPTVLAALDVLVVPSILPEAFGMVAAEAASTGALPLVARHSGLVEVADALERAVGGGALFSYEPGRGAPARIAEGIRRLVDLPPSERQRLRDGVSAFVAREWTWERTAQRLLEAARA